MRLRHFSSANSIINPILFTLLNKTIMTAKNLFFKVALSAIVLAAGTFFFSCSKDDDDNNTPPVQVETPSDGATIITVSGATYQTGTMPAATSGESIGTLEMNTQALAGGGSFVSIVSPNDYSCFYVSIAGMNGYFVVQPTSKTHDSHTGQYTYQFNISFSESFNANVTVVICGVVTGTGAVTQHEQTTVKFIESQTGALDIKLVFENDKDIDLHLYTPGNEHIYYANRGMYNDNGEQVYGLDKDSNASCEIDGLNNENIFIPMEYLEEGEYTVKVNMYENCDRQIPTSWSVTVRFQGQLIENHAAGYGNPATGTYPVNAPAGDKTTVFTFYLTAVQAAAAKAKAQFAAMLRPYQPTDIDLLKMEQEQINLSLRNAH